MTIFEIIKEILIDSLECEAEITLDSNFYNDWGLDQEDLEQLKWGCEDIFRIEISNDDMIKLDTVGKLVTYISNKTKTVDKLLWMDNNH